ncbi:MAG: hypothetical protein KKB79_01925 [Nanoarchaeota archaeon]|nr:hypothetical protein [Nanoarchaeota archaeon]
MKTKNKVFIFSLFLILISITPTLLAIETQFTKESNIFDQGETLIAKISGNFVDRITTENTLFYQDHIRIPITYDVKKLNDDFYIYALLIDKPSGNYSIRINDVDYMDGLKTTDAEIRMNFTITSETADFYVTPGVVESNDDFSLELRSLGGATTKIDIDSQDAFTHNSSVELTSGGTKNVNFFINDSEKILREIILSSEGTTYNVPVLAGNPNTPPSNKELSFKFEPNNIEVSLATNSEATRIIYLVNNNDEDIEDVFLSLSSSLKDYATITPNKIENLKAGETEKVEILFESSEISANISGDIIASSNTSTTYLSISLSFIPDYVPSEDEEDTESILTTCSQLGGSICGDEERCSEETLPTKDGLCCPASGSCEEIKKSNTGKWIGWGIILLVIVFLAYFFKKYKKARPSKDLLSMAKGKN